MFFSFQFRLFFVNCRVGSLEISCKGGRDRKLVNCRVGSLEIDTSPHLQKPYVNCRVGSLEIEYG